MRGRRLARGIAVAALAVSGVAAGLLVGRGVALGDTVTGTTGDISYSVTWTQGPGANQTTLVVQNTAGVGGHTISDFLFLISGAPQITSVTGGGCSTSDFSHNPLPNGEIECGAPLDPGQSETITITTAAPVATGTTGYVTFSDDAESQQPTVNVPLQDHTPTGSTATSTGATQTTTTQSTMQTTTQTTTQEPCHCVKWDDHLSNVRAADHGNLILFTLHWTLECSAGAGKCKAPVKFEPLRFRDAGAYLTLKDHHGLLLSCKGECGSRPTTGKVEAELHWARRHRHERTYGFSTVVACPPGHAPQGQFFQLHFDAHGNFDAAGSLLG